MNFATAAGGHHEVKLAVLKSSLRQGWVKV